MNDIRSFFAIIIIFSIFFYILDVYYTQDIYDYKNCEDLNKVKVVLFLHHLGFTFGLFGFLSNNKYILTLYVLFPFLLVLHWQTNDNKCFLTEYINEKCRFYDRTYFKDVWFYVGLKNSEHYSLAYQFILAFVWLIAVTKLYTLHYKKK